jgi:hypothetical protein
MSEVPRLYLEIDAVQAEPPLEKIFLESGGSINAAASRGDTDFALTGSRESSTFKLSDTFSSTCRIPIPHDHVGIKKDMPMTVELDARAKLLITTSRDGAAINGSIVSSVAGQTAVYLSKILRTASPHAAIPVQYANWTAHSAVICASNFRIVDEAGRHYNVHFVGDEKRDAALKAGEQFISAWADGAWKMRQNTAVYPYSPSLTKCVFKTPAGINDCGYDLVHNAIHQPIPHYSYTTTESMLKQAISVELEFVPEDIDSFLGTTKSPGLAAAGHGRTVAAALSTLASFLVSYRADGRTNIMPNGSVTVSAESWLRQGPRTPIEANDCDGSAIAVLNLANTCTNAPADVLDANPFMKAVHNVINPYYTVGISVLGASSAEASSGGKGGEKAKSLAGHAAALMIPSLSLLRSLDRGSTRTSAGEPIVALKEQGKIAEARFKAVFNSDVIGALPEEEVAVLGSWTDAKNHAVHLDAFGMEGTTPASPILYATGAAATSAVDNSSKDQMVFDKVGPTIGRSVKILYVGGAEAASPHKFYHDFVEYTVPRTSPLWTDTGVRALGAAGTQFVLSNHVDNGTPIENAGVTPRELATETYAAVPLVVADEATAAIIDFASQAADADVMPPRAAEAMKLDEFKSAQLDKSLDALKQLDDSMQGRDPGNGHAVAYVIAYSTLVNNPAAVQHLCTRLKAVAHAGMVDALDIDGLMQNASGKEAGKLVVINAVVPL